MSLFVFFVVVFVFLMLHMIGEFRLFFFFYIAVSFGEVKYLRAAEG